MTLSVTLWTGLILLEKVYGTVVCNIFQNTLTVKLFFWLGSSGSSKPPLMVVLTVVDVPVFQLRMFSAQMKGNGHDLTAS
jgi:hypothetical protein